ncbi:hypothetical protein C8J55DRAFT_534745 [Lentinula edodes]|uniref:C2H2-type domain-containing protein n=1 Tax=Lentinula lateritia TaxID=40482 RepID=A0A9W9DWP8_9AGAR|nr:hypothetical protein C8J55DRAFT_534745 [Lentinula edodes]
MAHKYCCPHCNATFPTLQGQRSHISQARNCTDKEEAAILATIQSLPMDTLPTVSENDAPGHENLEEGHQSEDTQRKTKHAYVEEVEDDPRTDRVSTSDPQLRYIQDYPRQAGTPLRTCELPFETLRKAQLKEGLEPWSPFQNKEEWELARWLMESGASQGKIDQFLKLTKVREDMKPPFKNTRTFLQFIDSLPRGPGFTCTPMKITGNIKDTNGDFRTEILELWHRNPLECVAEILANPLFTNHQVFEPERVFRQQKDGVPSNREYNEMWTGNWWWDTQDMLPDGATIAPIIIASDETRLSAFCGDKKAWPLFHDCMRTILEPLIAKGLAPTEMACADGYLRNVHALLAAYVGDYPEQCRVACCRENSCPRCTVAPTERGEPGPLNSTYRDPVMVVEAISRHSKGWKPPEFEDQNLRPMNPFWKDLPLCNIFECITPDLLHQLHKGVFSDHVASWARKSIENGQEEIDVRYQAMPTHPTLRHFKQGISKVTQWTGGEYRSMAKVFLGTLAGAAEPGVIRAVRALEDFMYYAHFETHCDESLAAMHLAWQTFHAEKSVFVDLKIRKFFNINKVHNIKHYVESICSRGTNDNFNTEMSERLHIDLAKAGYRASNRRNFMVQMTIWLARQEAVHRFTAYLKWAVCNYNPQGLEDNDEEEDDDDELDEPVGRLTEDSLLGADREYHVAKTPPMQVTIDSVEKDFHADWFLWYLNDYLYRNSLIDDPNNSDLTPDTLIPIYKQARIHLPPLPEAISEKSVDIIQATKALPSEITARGFKAAQPAKTSTVLVRTDKSDPRKGPLHGLQAARVLLIFQLPSLIHTRSEPLAFLHLFKPFNRLPVPDFNMFQTSYAHRQHAKHGTILPLSQIVQTCHLTPHFGRKMNRAWDSANVLDSAEKFYLNPYLRHRDFYLLRHQFFLYEKAKDHQEHEMRRKRLRMI